RSVASYVEPNWRAYRHPIRAPLLTTESSKPLDSGGASIRPALAQGRAWHRSFVEAPPDAALEPTARPSIPSPVGPAGNPSPRSTAPFRTRHRPDSDESTT